MGRRRRPRLEASIRRRTPRRERVRQREQKQKRKRERGRKRKREQERKQRRRLGNPLPRLAHAAILVPRRGAFRAVGTPHPLHHVGASARMARHGPSETPRGEPRGVHAGGVSADVQLEHHRTEHRPHRGARRTVRTLQRRHLSAAGHASRIFFPPRRTVRHGASERRAAFVGGAYRLQRPRTHQCGIPPARRSAPPPGQMVLAPVRRGQPPEKPHARTVVVLHGHLRPPHASALSAPLVRTGVGAMGPAARCLVPQHLPLAHRSLALARPLRRALPRRIRTPRLRRQRADDARRRDDRSDLGRDTHPPPPDDLPQRQRLDRRLRSAEPPPRRGVRSRLTRKIRL